MAQILAMRTSIVCASSGRVSSTPRPRVRLAPAHIRLVQRPSRQTQEHCSNTARARAAACRPAAFTGGPWGGNCGPMGFGCGGSVQSEDLNRMAQEFEKAMRSGTMGATSAAAQVPVAMDVAETREAFVFTADLPGVQRADTKVQANKQDRMLTISGERLAPAVPEEEKDMRRRHERRFGKFRRTFQLPEGADLNNIKASFKDGVLIVRVSRSQPAEAPVVDIPVDDWLSGGSSA